MAFGTDFHMEILTHRGFGLEAVTTRTNHLNISVLGVNFSFHNDFQCFLVSGLFGSADRVESGRR